MRPSSPEASLRRFVRALVGSDEASAALGVVGDRRRFLWVGGTAATCDTRFDLASLTKPFVATLALSLDRDGLLGLQTRIGDCWPGAGPVLARRRLADLLRHRSGLPAWVPLGKLAASPAEVPDLLTSGLPVRAGAQVEYSDLGYLLWGLTAERALAQPLWRLLSEHVAVPLRLAGLAPWPGTQDDVAVSRLDTSRERELAAARGFGSIAVRRAPHRGQPQDGNARFMGRFTGHAGLFGRAEDLHRLAREWLAPGRLLRPGEIAKALGGSGRYALGWERRRVRGSGGPALGERAFGHTGFTGTSLWIDPARERIYCLLAHRRRADSDFNRWRRDFHVLAARI